MTYIAIMFLLVYLLKKSNDKINYIRHYSYTKTYSLSTVAILRILQVSLLFAIVLKPVEIYFIFIGDKFGQLYEAGSIMWRLYNDCI